MKKENKLKVPEKFEHRDKILYARRMKNENKNHEEEIEKIFHFYDSHNIMTSQPKGVMAVSEARKLVRSLKEHYENKRKKFIKEVEDKESKCPEGFIRLSDIREIAEGL